MRFKATRKWPFDLVVPETVLVNQKLLVNAVKTLAVTEFSCFVRLTAVKGEISRKFAVISNPKMFVCQQKQQNNRQVCYKLSPSAIKLSISASGQRQSRLVWIET